MPVKFKEILSSSLLWVQQLELLSLNSDPLQQPSAAAYIRAIKIKEAPYFWNDMSIPYSNMLGEQREQSIFLIEANSW